MHFTAIIAAALVAASSTMANPAMRRNPPSPPPPPPVNVCAGLPGTPQCCATNVLNLADLNCAPPPVTPESVAEFTKICAAIGQQAQCCVLPVLGQGLICEAPDGVPV